MPFVLTGFTHDMGFRVFAFARMGQDSVETRCTVRADLALVRQYGIHLQELPLLCRGLLDRRDEGEQARSFTFTEDQMRVCADQRSAREGAARKRKPPVRPSA